ncbi:nucleoside triphosphate pyrophosphohydrolase [uncultured Caudovirales phage]|uniref:Nucleoside triphosphate pyrophosphohydrolase n=1 Tax=uncultured Caudovirales phage TaxID=2100421 RepID=A0A6J5RIH7_9CAUD|nr:nucleoside triphosphate pyrophosphohydrolase [uncultured Caudovirales phage]
MKQAAVMLIIKDGLILSVSRRDDKTKFGLAGGKCESGESTKDAAIRETLEETGVNVTDCIHIYKRYEPSSYQGGQGFEAHCYYANTWSGMPSDSEEGVVTWLTAEELTGKSGAFPDYNRKTLDQFKIRFPDVYIKGE